MPLKLVPRDHWDAEKPAKRVVPLPVPVPVVLVKHHFPWFKPCEGFRQCRKQLMRIKEHHVLFLGFPDIQYNFMIGTDGAVYEGRGWTTNPSKTDVEYLNTLYKRSLDVVYMGKYINKDPPKVMVDARDELIYEGMKNGYIQPGHTLIVDRKRRNFIDRELIEVDEIG